jgi:RNA polymerase subunit RPABC4/transcription elongation factor Spt4
MSTKLACYRCGELLARLTLPLSRRDQCPSCSADLHVCKMCRYFDATVTRQCREDGAEDVTEKERPNFCDWFKPSAQAFDASRKTAADDARSALSALFGDGVGDGNGD